MKAPWAGLLGSIEGTVFAVFVGGLLVGIFGWRLDTTAKISAFLAVVLLVAIAGWSIGTRVAHRRAARSSTQTSSS
jgi:F0F1-type ATP synthase assembly protein I